MKKFWIFVLIFIFTLPAVDHLLTPGYFNMHDDLQVMRIFQMEKCLSDGQIPCRWSPDMGYGYGQAMFNFYSVSPYYLGALIRIITPLSIMATVKILFLISLVGGAFGMYLLARQFWGNRGGFLAAILYTYAPYHALDVFIRGALAESFALAILPFLWLGFYLLIKKPTFPRIAGTAISLAALLTTHNVSTLIYAPFTVLWVLFWIVRFKDWKNSLKSIAVSGFLGLGLAAFFLLPAILEQPLIKAHYLTVDYYDFRAHFVTLRQLFLDRSWGDGPSIFGPVDDISFQIGWPHWWLAVFLPFLAVYWFRKCKKKIKAVLLLGLLGLFLFSAFLTHPRSIFIWQRIPIMAFVQFPWRFLGLTIFFLSFAGGALVKFNFRFKKLLIFTVLLLAIILNFQYFIPIHFSSKVKDEEKLRGLAFELQQRSAILDYLPKTAEIAPEAVAPSSPKIIAGEGEITGFIKQSDRFSFDAQIHEEAQVEIPVMYFPGWVVISNSSIIPTELHGIHGVIKITLPAGKHIIRGRFQNTPVRTVGNTLTVVSVLILLSGALIYENKRRRA